MQMGCYIFPQCGELKIFFHLAMSSLVCKYFKVSEKHTSYSISNIFKTDLLLGNYGKKMLTRRT